MSTEDKESYQKVKQEEHADIDKYNWSCVCKKSCLLRFFAMLLLCSTSLSVMINMEGIGAYQEVFMESFNITTADFSLMISISSWATILLGSFEGILIDKVFGVNLGSFIYLAIYTFGIILTGVAVFVSVMWCALVGLLITGMGTPGFFNCLMIYCVKFFKEKELSLMLSMMLSVTKFGSSAMYAMAYPLLTHVKETYTDNTNESTGIALFIALSFLLAAYIFLSILSLMNPSSKDVNHPSNSKEKMRDRFKLRNLIRSAVDLPLNYWLVQLTSCCVTTVLYIMLPFVQLFFMVHFSMDVETANTISSNTSIFAGVIAPFIGICVDRWGREIWLAFSAFIISIFAYLLLAFAPITPYVGMCIISIAFGMLSATITPMVAMVVPEDKLGFAFGIATSLGGLVFSLYTYIVGIIIDNHGYVAMTLFCAAHGVLGSVVVLMIARIDKKSNGILCMTPMERRIHFKKMKNNHDADSCEPLKPPIET